MIILFIIVLYFFCIEGIIMHIILLMLMSGITTFALGVVCIGNYYLDEKMSVFAVWLFVQFTLAMFLGMEDFND